MEVTLGWSRYGAVLLLAAPAVKCRDSGTAEPGGKAIEVIDYARGHSCRFPTAHRPDLISCPRDHLEPLTATPGIDEAIEAMTLGVPPDLYQPVHLDHEQHAKMAKMGAGYGTLHVDRNQEIFRYAIIGSAPDEVDEQQECTDCRPERTLDRDPECGDCRADGRTAVSMPEKNTLHNGNDLSNQSHIGRGLAGKVWRQ